ncbi:hypothetical protein [Streptomyces sp. NPDC102437]|uniref:hypothetical protein n=1 Tax=Streptomyces sp. NPDC102437 TaxID=3366175 RepID=UPI003819CB6B
MRNHSGHDQTNRGHHGGHGGARPGGLSVSENGYTLELDSTILTGGVQPISFRVIGPDGQAVTEFIPEHEKELHFIAVRRDTAGFQHVHPVMDGKGAWSVELALEPGDWRFFTDIPPVGHDGTMTLGIDVAVAGPYDPRPLPEATGIARIGEYTVVLDGELLPGEASELTPHRQPGQPPRHRPAALPGRVRTPGGPAGRRPGLPPRPSGGRTR